MNKQLTSRPEIVLQGTQPSEDERKAEVISEYLEKYAIIAGRALTPALYQVYIEALGGYELRRIEKGLKAYLEQGTAFPWPGVLAQFIEDEI